MNGMTRALSIGVFICGMLKVTSPLQTLHTPPEETHVPEPYESTYYSHHHYPQQSHPNYRDGPRTDHFDPPHNLNFPHFHDVKWPHHHDYNRRTFSSDLPYGHRGTTTSFPTLYHFMTSLFAPGDDYPGKLQHYNRHRPTPPYPFHNPYSITPTEPNYIPPPKPIRASVVKLESVTRSPFYSSFQPETTTKYFHGVGSLLNHVLIENSKSPQHSAFHPQELVHEEKIPPFKPLPVLPTPSYIPPTSMPPLRYNKTDYKYPESVQDQLPHLQLGDPKIPYVPEKSIPQIFATLPTESSPGEQFDYTTNILDLIDIRSLNLSGTSPPEKEQRFESGGTKIKSYPGAVEKVNRPIIRFTKKLSTFPDRSSVERVTNLTVQGLTKTGEVGNPPKLVNHHNARDPVGNEMSRPDNSSKGLVNLNDELSLDAKILKDTNWDGFSPSPHEETSTPLSEPRKNKPAFWEIVEEDKASTPVTESTNQTLATDRGRSETTTEWWSATRDNTETNEPSTTTEGTTTTTGFISAQPRSGGHLSPESAKATLESVIILTERTPRRRYSRRPKMVNFTPYPTTEEIQRRLANRNHFAKRQKPNITLAFGNKNVLKSGQQSLVKDEVMKFSSEEVRKRRKIGKRRQLYERTRSSTSERSLREDSL